MGYVVPMGYGLVGYDPCGFVSQGYDPMGCGSHSLWFMICGPVGCHSYSDAVTCHLPFQATGWAFLPLSFWF